MLLVDAFGAPSVMQETALGGMTRATDVVLALVVKEGFMDVGIMGVRIGCPKDAFCIEPVLAVAAAPLSTPDGMETRIRLGFNSGALW